mgnify:CR=1 FL=1
MDESAESDADEAPSRGRSWMEHAMRVARTPECARDARDIAAGLAGLWLLVLVYLRRHASLD